jgi:hypothetical protein
LTRKICTGKTHHNEDREMKSRRRRSSVMPGLGASPKRKRRVAKKASSKRGRISVAKLIKAGTHKVVAKSTAMRKTGKLKKGCMAGRGAYKGKFICRKGKAA